MSDLHRAVEDEIDAFRPDRTPPFAAVLARQRARSRRRAATGAAALSVVTVAGIVLLPSALSGGEDRLPSVANPGPTQEAEDQGLAARLCADAAQVYEGQVAAAYATTVQAVRDYMTDPHSTGGDSSIGPVPGPYTYPVGWAEKAPGDPAATCYVDVATSIPIPLPPGAPPADRALIMSAEGADAFTATAGPKGSLPTAPLTEPNESQAASTTTPDETWYSITYSDRATYEQQIEAVGTCVTLPGTSDVHTLFSLPPVTGLTVTGADENATFQTCMSGLEGVTLTAKTPKPPDPDGTPTAPSPPECSGDQIPQSHEASVRCLYAAFLNQDRQRAARYASSRAVESIFKLGGFPMDSQWRFDGCGPPQHSQPSSGVACRYLIPGDVHGVVVEIAMAPDRSAEAVISIG